MTIGTPPLSDVPSMARAFKNDPSVGALFTAEVSPAQAKAVARALWGAKAPAPPYLARTILATDPRARGTLGRSLSEDSLSSEVATIAALPFPVAILLGERDGLVDADYVRALPIPNAWRALPLILQGSGHCPMLDAPGGFERLAEEYIKNL
jgi:pimeloyl-ACP methyl ester carboxylesterase